MSRGEEHRLIIQRHGRSHRAWCVCGWAGHAWNELRPAEADAWHHLYGDSTIVDISVIPDAADGRGTQANPWLATQTAAPAGPQRPSSSSAELVHEARALADSPSPYAKQAVRQLWTLAAEDRDAIRSAISEVDELLRRHSRHSASTADSEWLQLITAKRLLQESFDHGGAASYP